MSKTDEILNIQRLIWVEKDYEKAKSIIENSSLSRSIEYQNLLGSIYFYQYDFQNSINIYKNIKNNYKIAYSYLLSNNVIQALNYFKIASPSPAQNWGLFFCELFVKDITTVPTYLQIRAFLEKDLTLFLKLNIADFVQKIIDVSEYLESINPETNKIIAKTFLYNDYPAYAKEFFIRAFDITDKDAELYYLSGLYYLKVNNASEAKFCFKKAIMLNNNYVPAIEQFNLI